MEQFLIQAKNIESWLIWFRRNLHQFPELGFQEERTAEKVLKELQSLDLHIRTGVGGYGIIAELEGGEPGPTVALRADMDALPIREETSLPFASVRQGVMHACGHDGHTAILLGAAKLLCGVREKLSGKVRFIFQSAEETLSGAKALIKDGGLDGVDEIYGLHNLPTLSVGKVGTIEGPTMASADRIEIDIVGRGGHGAMPNQCVDPIVAASAIVMGLQTAVSREISPFESSVITIGSIHAGEANNVIPQRSLMTGTVRTFDAGLHQRMPDILERMIRNISQAYRCDTTFNYTRQASVLVNDQACTKLVEEVVSQLVGHDNWRNVPATMGTEDFSEYLQYVPGCFFWLGSGPDHDAEHAYGLHHPKFDLDERCISLGAAFFAAIATKRLSR